MPKIEHTQLVQPPERLGQPRQAVVRQDERLQLGQLPDIVGNCSELLLPQVQVLHAASLPRNRGLCPPPTARFPHGSYTTGETAAHDVSAE